MASPTARVPADPACLVRKVSGRFPLRPVLQDLLLQLGGARHPALGPPAFQAANSRVPGADSPRRLLTPGHPAKHACTASSFLPIYQALHPRQTVVFRSHATDPD